MPCGVQDYNSAYMRSGRRIETCSCCRGVHDIRVNGRGGKPRRLSDLYTLEQENHRNYNETVT